MGKPRIGVRHRPNITRYKSDENDSDSDEFERLHVMMKKQKSNTATATQSRPTRQRRKASTSIKFKFEDESDVSEEVDESSDFVPSAEEAAVSSSDEDEEARRSKPRADASLTPSNLQGNPTKSTPRSSTRIREKRQKRLRIPSQKEIRDEIDDLASPLKNLSEFQPRKLVNNFTKVHNRYNFDENPTDGESSIGDFLDDDEDSELEERRRRRRKRAKKQEMNKKKSRIVVVDSSDSDEERPLTDTRSKRRRSRIDSDESSESEAAVNLTKRPRLNSSIRIDSDSGCEIKSGMKRTAEGKEALTEPSTSDGKKSDELAKNEPDMASAVRSLAGAFDETTNARSQPRGGAVVDVQKCDTSANPAKSTPRNFCGRSTEDKEVVILSDSDRDSMDDFIVNTDEEDMGAAAEEDDDSDVELSVSNCHNRRVLASDSEGDDTCDDEGGSARKPSRRAQMMEEKKRAFKEKLKLLKRGPKKQS